MIDSQTTNAQAYCPKPELLKARLIKMASGGSTVVEHIPHQQEVENSSRASFADSEKENGKKDVLWNCILGGIHNTLFFVSYK